MKLPAGRLEYIETLLDRHEAALYRTAAAITQNKEDAEDAVQEAFARVMEKEPKFNDENHERAWLIHVTVNICRSILRSPARARREELLDIYPAETPEQFELLDSIAKLPPDYRAVIHLFYYEGYPVKDIAKLLKRREGTVRSMLTRARQKLGSLLKEDNNAGI